MSMPWAARPHRSFADIRNGAGRKAMNPSHPKYRDDGYARELSDLAKDRECEFRAKDAKERGNDALADGNFSAAVQFYTTAVDLNYRPELHIHYSNRSAAYAKLGKFDLALEDSDRCILVRPDWAKCYFRKGCALQGLRRPAEAAQAFQLGLSIDPANEGLKRALAGAGKMQREAANDFEEINDELHDASRQGDAGLVGQLLAAKHDPAMGDREGNTPLHYAAWEGHTNVVQLLTDSSHIDINSQNKLGQTPLHLASWWGKQQVADWLVNCKADLNARDSSGETPLHHAARNSRDGLIGLLCDSGAATRITSQAGQTPFDVADECCPLSTCRHEACAVLLKEYGEKEAQTEAANRPMGLAALPVGTVVTVSGLTSATQHNGKKGAIVSWNEEKGRFLVEMDQGGTLALKQSSLTGKFNKRKRRPDSKPEGNTSVYVTGLPTTMGDVTDQFLNTYFGRIGKVFRVKAYKNFDGSLKGDALVTYRDADDAEKAVNLLHRQEIRSDCPISVVVADFTQSAKRTVRLKPEITKTFKMEGGLGINFSDDWEIEEITPGSQADLAGLRCALWLTHIQGELIVGKSRDQIYTAFGAAGRPISLGFITYRPPSLQEYDISTTLLLSSTLQVEEERAAEQAKRFEATKTPNYFGDLGTTPDVAVAVGRNKSKFSER